MKFRVLVILLHIVILILCGVHVFFSLETTCYYCDHTLIIGQYLDVVIFGYMIIIGMICTGFCFKETIPLQMQMAFNFTGAVLYFVAAVITIGIAFDFVDINLIIQLGGHILIGGLHLCLGLLHLKRDKIPALT